MNDEIKEILDKLKSDNYPFGIATIDINKLEDYITNLQQENEELKKNQRYYKNGVFSLEYDKETLSDMVDDYKSRCEKAIEFIQNKNNITKHGIYPNYTYEVDTKDLFNILQNGSDTSE